MATPTVFFHFYTLYVSGEIEKLRNTEAKLRAMEEGEDSLMVSGKNTTKQLLLVLFSVLS